ncbi:hypothetical protein [Streptomyces xanthophaeus]|uniref:hypothetical protein n=1 Tax=Streptomyces xanthophaeus TaxID=67385 RepID=UPI0036699B68
MVASPPGAQRGISARPPGTRPRRGGSRPAGHAAGQRPVRPPGPSAVSFGSCRVRAARLGDPAALAGSPLLLSCPRLGTPEARSGWLRSAVPELADAQDRADPEAGTILRAYYLGRGRTQHQVARRPYLSRAAYFRRLRRGLALVAARLPR